MKLELSLENEFSFLQHTFIIIRCEGKQKNDRKLTKKQ